MRLVLSIAVAGILSLIGSSSWAEGGMDAAALAKALPQAAVSLDQALKASEPEGTPISAKYEIENGTLQLSVYTMKGAKFSEVIVDHKSGAIAKSEPITDADDMNAAQMQSAAIAKAKLALEAAVGSAVKGNAGYRAVEIVPALDGGRPVAVITLMKGQDVKKVTEKLD